MKSITVFCGSSTGTDKMFYEQAYLLGETLAKRNIRVVYGGARIGLMGAVADGVLKNGGEVIGVIPTFLMKKEVAHDHLTALIQVDTMHQRKAKMNDLCDGILALPGGFGTLEEFFEMLTWGQLGLHAKPVALLNVSGFYDPLITLIQTMVTSGFLKKSNQEMVLVDHEINSLLDKMEQYTPPHVGKWITKETT